MIRYNLMKKINLVILFILIFLNVFFVVFYFDKNNDLFELSFIDVGQGNSIIIKTESGKKIIIDSGNEMIGLSNISKYLGFFNHDFDLIFATHYDADHVGIFPFLIDNFKTGQFFDSSASFNNSIRDEILKRLKVKNKNIISLSSGDKIIVDENTTIEVLFPDNFFEKGILDNNESSLVLKIYHNNLSFLITGDLPKKFENYLVKKYGKRLKSNVLMAGHHGSKTSSSSEFLEAVSPGYFIISVGKENSYNLPNDDILKRVSDMNIKILRTDLMGNITFEIKDNKLFFKE